MKDSISKFYEMINSSDEMQKKLTTLDKAFAEKHDLPSPDAAADIISSFRKQALDEIVIPVAKEAGFDFTSDDLMAYAQEMSANSGQELCAEELQAVAGGTGVFACFGLGIGLGEANHGNDGCIIVGWGGIGACAVVGAEA